MAKKTKTQIRSYTLQLKTASDCTDWLPLWNRIFLTHRAVCEGARAFGELYLTLRGGLSPALAEDDLDELSEEDKVLVRRGRRRMLALGWLSVEDADGSEKSAYRISEFDKGHVLTKPEVDSQLRRILNNKGVADVEEHQSWVDDCVGALTARIRDDAVWVDRATAFEAWRKIEDDKSAADMIGQAKAILWSVFGGRFLTLSLQTERPEQAAVEAENEQDNDGQSESNEDAVSEEESDPSNASRGVYSDLFGGDAKEKQARSEAKTRNAAEISNFLQGQSNIAKLSDNLSKWREDKWGKLDKSDPDRYPPEVTSSGAPTAVAKRYRKLLVGLNLWPPSNGETGEPRPEAAAKYAKQLTALSANHEKVRTNMLDLLAGCKKATEGHETIRVFTPPWASGVLMKLAQATGLSNSDASSTEFRRLMFALAARRLSQTQSWIKRNEAERHKAAENERAAKSRLMEHDPEEKAQNWLRRYEAKRCEDAESQRGFRITRRAIGAWDDVVKKWNGASREVRQEAIREVQETSEKFGESRLFHDLAADDGADGVWKKADGTITTDILKEWVKLRQAEFDQARLKIPRYCHPDPFLHPTWCEFGGSSKPKVWYAWAGKAMPENPESGGNADGIHRLWMQLPHGSDRQTRPVPLRWISKRLQRDLGGTGSIPRADRLGRSLLNLEPQLNSSFPLYPFADECKKGWNARLQADRETLEYLRQLWDARKHDWTDGGTVLKYLRWFITFAPELAIADGPWGKLKKELGFKKFPNGELNQKQKREGHAKLVLSRYQGLRVLSVDLGHRFAAACAVWETLSIDDFKKEIAGRDIVAGSVSGLFVHTRHKDEKRKDRTTIYRRIGPDEIAMARGKLQDHPAPWARLDRQFLVKLQGEQESPRLALESERELVKDFAERLGWDFDIKKEKCQSVAELMARAVRLAELGLRRHGRRAKIAYALDPATKVAYGVGGKPFDLEKYPDAGVNLILDALVDWHALASDSKWQDRKARKSWNNHIACLGDNLRIDEKRESTSEERKTSKQQRAAEETELRERLKPVVESLVQVGTGQLANIWRERWEGDDGSEREKDDFEHHLIKVTKKGKLSRTSVTTAKRPTSGWHADLRWMTDWIMGWRLAGETDQRWERNVGGLSLTRMATIRQLYQLHKAFTMRSRPQNPRGAPEKGETNAGVAQKLLKAMERMREQRVKQTASRIAGAALGLGGHWEQIDVTRRDRNDDSKSKNDGTIRTRKRRVWVEETNPKYPACHAIVIENLKHYRPDEMQTRRENRGLMTWASSKVRKYLKEACDLHGIWLAEVQPNYTSRQCSRTGLPGVRCNDLAVEEFIRPCRAVKGAVKRMTEKDMPGEVALQERLPRAIELAKAGKGKPEDRFLLELFARWNPEIKTWTDADGIRWILRDEDWILAPGQDAKLKKCKAYIHPRPVRLIVKGGEHFVAAKNRSEQPVPGSSNGLQADLNAAANIGLRALLDPDFAGKWWYIPCEENKTANTAIPLPKYTRGSVCFPADPAQFGSLTKEKEVAAEGAKEITNFWMDPSISPLRNADAGSFWLATKAYWPWVRNRVVAVLRELHGLTEYTLAELKPDTNCDQRF